ncbi:MAG TPA: hypothetical protein DCP71_08410 [Verrucomicrobiales bacterium]|jgi:hypothetical protein|nr:hypothetical protein [Verrucomicrobiales bacterium]
MPVDNNVPSIHDDDEEHIGGMCANMNQVVTVIPRTINALDNLIPEFMSAQLSRWDRMHVRPYVEQWIGHVGHIPHGLGEHGQISCFVE